MAQLKPSPSPFTATDKLRAVRRELALRQNVYRKKVIAGTMTQAAANRELAIMQAIERDYLQQTQRGSLL